ncbi:hypothetical protein [Paraferrimonas sp. SM1919]|uniref:hypothetical protein n=1 Tax=Paraferrimonas sp. SM1919 TaxID=2662263 RepID=UPI0013D70035|nr:hypothetical protein [Paraferrimonas sp. SM1919]
MIDTWGPVAAPDLSLTPIDPTKVYGNLNLKYGRDVYDFWDRVKGLDNAWTLNQSYSGNAFNKVVTFFRNNLNHIAINQHGYGHPYEIILRNTGK